MPISPRHFFHAERLAARDERRCEDVIIVEPVERERLRRQIGQPGRPAHQPSSGERAFLDSAGDLSALERSEKLATRFRHGRACGAHVRHAGRAQLELPGLCGWRDGRIKLPSRHSLDEILARPSPDSLASLLDQLCDAMRQSDPILSCLRSPRRRSRVRPFHTALQPAAGWGQKRHTNFGPRRAPVRRGLAS